MELTREEAEKMLYERINQNPVIARILSNRAFNETLEDILEVEEIDLALLPVIKNETLVILAFYAPISELGKNIAETTGLPLENAENISLLVEALLFSEISNDLYAFEYLWNQELKKELGQEKKQTTPTPETKPAVDGGVEARPLTREELMQKLSPRRTMVEDVASVQHPQPSQTPSTPVRGYEAYQNSKGPGTGR